MTNAFLILVGRVILGAIYLYSGATKVLGFGETAGYMEAYGMPLTWLLLPLAILVELGGALLVIIGYQTRLAALALALFTVVAAVIFHAYWTVEGPEALNQMGHFMKNFGMIAGFLMLMGHGPGRLSVDAMRTRA